MKTHQCLRDSHEPGHVKFILAKIQNLQRSVALQHLSNVSDPGLQHFNGYSSGHTIRAHSDIITPQIQGPESTEPRKGIECPHFIEQCGAWPMVQM